MNTTQDQLIVSAVLRQVERLGRLRNFDPEAARQLGVLGWLVACVGALDEAIAAERWDSVRERMAMLREAAIDAAWRPGDVS